MTESFFRRPFFLRGDVRRQLRAAFAAHLTPSMQVFDIGCGDKPFAADLAGKVAAHIGVDLADGFYDRSHADRIGTAYAVPAADGEADAVISSQVIEHLEDPDQAFREMARILKPGGILLLSFPFLYPIHAQPRDFFRYTEYGARDLLHRHGFEVAEFHRIGGFWYVAGLNLSLYLQGLDRGILRRFNLVKLLSWLLRVLLYGLHRLEGFCLARTGRDAGEYRAMWTVNYVIVARRALSPAATLPTS